LTVDWGSILGTIFPLAFLLVSTQADEPLGPWRQLNSSAYVYVINESHEDVTVTVYASQVDGAKRVIGRVHHCFELPLRLPYADADVHVVLASTLGVREYVLHVDGPKVWKVVYSEDALLN